MAITVKKKKLTVKTIKAGAAPDGSVEGEEGAIPAAAADAAAGATGADAAAPQASMAPAAAPAYAGPVTKPASYTVAGVFAIITLVFFLVLIALQALELDTYTGCFPENLVSGTSMAPLPTATALTPAVDAAPVVPEPVTPEPAKDAVQ